MRIFLNLLPEEKKIEIERNKKFKLIIWQEFIFLFIVVFFICMLASTNLVLKVEFSGMESAANIEKSQEKYQELQSSESEFSQANSKIKTLVKLDKSHLHWTNVLRALDAAVTDEITLSELATDNLQVTIIGKAKTRDGLLRLKEDIAKSDCFADVKIPLSDLVQKEDVEFQVDFMVEEKCIKQT